MFADGVRRSKTPSLLIAALAVPQTPGCGEAEQLCLVLPFFQDSKINTPAPPRTIHFLLLQFRVSNAICSHSSVHLPCFLVGKLQTEHYESFSCSKVPPNVLTGAGPQSPGSSRTSLYHNHHKLCSKGKETAQQGCEAAAGHVEKCSFYLFSERLFFSCFLSSRLPRPQSRLPGGILFFFASRRSYVTCCMTLEILFCKQAAGGEE